MNGTFLAMKPKFRIKVTGSAEPPTGNYRADTGKVERQRH